VGTSASRFGHRSCSLAAFETSTSRSRRRQRHADSVADTGDATEKGELPMVARSIATGKLLTKDTDGRRRRTKTSPRSSGATNGTLARRLPASMQLCVFSNAAGGFSYTSTRTMRRASHCGNCRYAEQMSSNCTMRDTDARTSTASITGQHSRRLTTRRCSPSRDRRPERVVGRSFHWDAAAPSPT